MHRFLLAGVRQAIAVPTREQATGPYSFVTGRPQYAPLDVTGQTSQCRSPPKRTLSPLDGNPFLNVAPVLAVGAASVFQDGDPSFGFDIDRGHALPWRVQDHENR
jgi:hypothetical protein